MTGNLSSDATAESRTQVLTSSVTYTYDDGVDATASTEIDQLDQFSGGSESDGQLSSGESGLITISGYNADGTDLSGTLTFTRGAQYDGG